MGKWAFLWITDLHYESPDSSFTDDGKELNEAYDEPLRESIFRDFHSILNADFRSLANPDAPDALSFIAIGGDVTTHGRVSGFDRFVKDALPRLNDFVAKPEAICIVPGNHDVVWGMNPTRPGYFIEKFKPFAVMVRDNHLSSCLFPRGELGKSKFDQEEGLSFNRPASGPLYIDHERRVIVLNVNSAIRCGELNLKMATDMRKHLGGPSGSTLDSIAAGAAPPVELKDFDESIRRYLIRDVAHVTQAQLRDLGEKLTKEKREIGEEWQSYLRVALVHHHLTPFPGQSAEHKGYEATVDSSRLLEFLTGFDFDMVLTGHKHQPYQLPYRFGGKEILILGGPTVGGFAPSENFRGFHFVEVETNHHGRNVQVRDIPCSLAKADIESGLRNLTRKPVASPHPSASTLIQPAASKLGFSYRDIVAISRINSDGDSRRIVECEDLVITKRCTRMSTHEIKLPDTSGYLDMLRPGSKRKEQEVFVIKDIPDNHATKSATVELGFSPELRIHEPGQKGTISYHYEWYAVNAFALDKLQYARKYGSRNANQRNVEFTHFIPVDPTERLTVIVQFPENLKLPYAPTLRIMRVDSGNEDSKSWKFDDEERNHLEDIRALRFFETLNIAALRVRAPKPNLSYGIQWSLPDAPNPVAPATVAALTTSLNTESDYTLKRVYRILTFSRDGLLSGWDRELDGTLMLFNMAETKGLLKIVAAGVASGPADGNDTMQRLEREVVLEYGEGIAGRAFKVNRVRIYVDPRNSVGTPVSHSSEKRFEPNFYKRVLGTLDHKVLICFPVHLPVSDAEFEKEITIYERREPYGVLNIGSGLEDCPVGPLLLPGRSTELLYFQHRVNKMLAEGYVGNKINRSK